MYQTARYVTEQAGLVLAGSFLLWPPQWQLAAFVGGMVLALCLHPVARLTAFIGYVGVVLSGRGMAFAWANIWRLAAAIVLVPLALLFMLFAGIVGQKHA